MSLHPDAFKMGVIANLVRMQAHTLWRRSHRQNDAHAIAERAYAMVVGTFVIFDDPSGTLARAYEISRATIVDVVAKALVDAVAET